MKAAVKFFAIRPERISMRARASAFTQDADSLRANALGAGALAGGIRAGGADLPETDASHHGADERARAADRGASRGARSFPNMVCRSSSCWARQVAVPRTNCWCKCKA